MVHVLVERRGRGCATPTSSAPAAAHVEPQQTPTVRLNLDFYRTFKLSKDPEFIAKLRDVVGLYMSAPRHALVLSIDEKSQIQALDRTQPSLPMKKGRPATMTHQAHRA